MLEPGNQKGDPDGNDQKNNPSITGSPLQNAILDYLKSREGAETKEPSDVLEDPATKENIIEQQERVQNEIENVKNPEEAKKEVFKDIAENLQTVDSLIKVSFTKNKGEKFDHTAFANNAENVLKELDKSIKVLSELPSIKFLLGSIYERYVFIYDQLKKTIKRMNELKDAKEGTKEHEEYQNLAEFLSPQNSSVTHPTLTRILSELVPVTDDAYNKMQQGMPFESVIEEIDKVLKLPSFPAEHIKDLKGLHQTADSNRQSVLFNYEHYMNGPFNEEKAKLKNVRLDEIASIIGQRDPLIDEIIEAAGDKINATQEARLRTLGSFFEGRGMDTQEILFNAGVFEKEENFKLVEKIYNLDAKYMYWRDVKPMQQFEKQLQAKLFENLLKKEGEEGHMEYNQELVEAYEHLEAIKKIMKEQSPGASTSTSKSAS